MAIKYYGEVIGGLAAAGIRVPAGFASTARAFRDFAAAKAPASACGAEIRPAILQVPFPAQFEKDILTYFQ